MGYVSDKAGHEGFPVSYVRREKSRRLMRELGHNDLNSVPPSEILLVGAACECGWRSTPFYPHRITFEGYAYPNWHPHSTGVSQEDEERIIRLWKAHEDAALLEDPFTPPDLPAGFKPRCETGKCLAPSAYRIPCFCCGRLHESFATKVESCIVVDALDPIGYQRMIDDCDGRQGQMPGQS